MTMIKILLMVIFTAMVMLTILLVMKQKKRTSSDGIKDNMKLLVLGALISFPVILVEFGVEFVVGCFALEGTNTYAMLDAFLVAAVTEEWFKWIVVKKRVFDKKIVNSRYDAIFYSAIVSLGFAVFESFLYAITGDVETAVVRCMTSIPGHVSFSLFIGHYYYKYKKSLLSEQRVKGKIYLLLSILVPVMLHGFYDYCLMWGSDEVIYIWLVFLPVLIIKAALTIKNAFKDGEVMYELLLIEDKQRSMRMV